MPCCRIIQRRKSCQVCLTQLLGSPETIQNRVREWPRLYHQYGSSPLLQSPIFAPSWARIGLRWGGEKPVTKRHPLSYCVGNAITLLYAPNAFKRCVFLRGACTRLGFHLYEIFALLQQHPHGYHARWRLARTGSPEPIKTFSQRGIFLLDHLTLWHRISWMHAKHLSDYRALHSCLPCSS